ncbi:hypothetical protein Plhal304r1_c001g0002141 [Plasmopara halstedii]
MTTTGILAGFLPALNKQISESVVEVTGEVENALHKRLDSTGDKKKQAKQLNAVAKVNRLRIVVALRDFIFSVTFAP